MGKILHYISKEVSEIQTQQDSKVNQGGFLHLSTKTTDEMFFFFLHNIFLLTNVWAGVFNLLIFYHYLYFCICFFIGTKYVKQKSNENAQIFGEKT